MRSKPCRQPSSPRVPWTMGKITSMCSSKPLPEVSTTCWLALPGTTASSRLDWLRAIRAGFSWLIRKFEVSLRCQWPALSMPIRMGSKRDRSRASTMLRADCSETSCSAERPPKIIPTRNLLMIRLAFESKASYHGWSAIRYQMCAKQHVAPTGKAVEPFTRTAVEVGHARAGKHQRHAGVPTERQGRHGDHRQGQQHRRR